MSSPLLQQPPATDIDQDSDDDEYNPFDDYADSRASTSAHPSPATERRSFLAVTDGSTEGFSDTTTTGRPLSAAPLHIRPASYNTSRQVPAVDPVHRPSYSLDSPRFKPPTRQTSWYLHDLEEEALVAPTAPSHVVEPPTPIPVDDQLLSGTEDRSESPSQNRGRSPQSHDLLLRPRLDRSATSYHTAHDSVSDDSISESEPLQINQRPLTMTSRGISPKPGELGVPHDAAASTTKAVRRQDSKKSISPKRSGLFGWRRSTSNRPESPSTTISDSRSVSPPPAVNPDARLSAGMIDGTPTSPVVGDHDGYFSHKDSYYGLPSPAPEGQHEMVQVEELLTELREISVELAASIRREMELEDEVDRYRSDSQTEHERPTSDYYSDSGSSSIRFSSIDSDAKILDLEKLCRKAEQERAQLRLGIANKAQEELNQRNALEAHVQSLEEQLRFREHADSQTEAAHLEKIKSHQAAMDVTKRRLSEERQVKENFEDLLNGMRQEITAYRTERDALRDEVIPKLHSRLEGFEAHNVEHQQLTEENERVLQENQSLRNENQTLANARRLQLDMAQTAAPRFRSIAEEDEEEPLSPRTPNTAGLSRSGSVARSKSIRAGRTGSVHQSKDGITVGEDGPESQNALEMQMDAMRRTLQALVMKQATMTRMHEKQMRKVLAERDNAHFERRRKNAFYLEIQSQRQELNHLRRRGDDAMESKWQCEKGLAGLKIDLDRALQETASLQEVLEQKDILASDRPSSQDIFDLDELPLEEAYQQLRALYDSALTTVQATADPEHPDTNVAALLASSTTRLEALDSQIVSQTSFNTALRDRLQGTVTRGMQEQQGAAQRITDLETALRAAEEEVNAAAGVSEEAIIEHEEHVRTMRGVADDKQRAGLSSVPATNPGPTHESQSVGLGLRMSMAPSQPKPFTSHMPRLHKTTSGKGMGVAEASKTEELESCVSGLEKLARSADGEMHGLLERMERSKVEVGTLQSERDDAIRQTRRLQREIMEEKERLRGLTGYAGSDTM